MTQFIPYLVFNGNCRQAMEFYRECLGGDLHLQTIADSPMADQLPEKMKDCILHSWLQKGQFMLMATDMIGEQGLIKGNSVSVLIQCSSEEEIRKLYHKLSAGGQPTHPIENTFWGAMFGTLTDQYGHHWMLNFNMD